jgi:hypothetical protein
MMVLISIYCEETFQSLEAIWMPFWVVIDSLESVFQAGVEVHFGIWKLVDDLSLLSKRAKTINSTSGDVEGKL